MEATNHWKHSPLIGYLPHHRLRELAQKHGPLTHLKLGEVSTIVVSSPEIAKEVMKTNDAIFAQRPHQVGADIMCYGSTDIATAPLGGYWKRLRRICSQELQSIREEEVMNLVRYIEANTGSCVNLSEKVACMTSAIIARATFGEKSMGQEEFISLVKKLVKLVERLCVFYLFSCGDIPKLKELHKENDTITGSIIGEAEKKTDEVEVASLLSVLLDIKNRDALEYPLTIDNIKAVMLNMFGAGTYTSAAVIEWAISEMLKNPRVMTKAQEEVRRVFGSKGYTNEAALDELKFLKAIIKETLRLHPPFPLLLPIECRETCEAKGYTIPAGTKVVVNAWAIARHPDYWSEPERFLSREIHGLCN